jgi:hypothetical protein
MLGSLLTAAPGLVAGFRWGMIISSIIYLVGALVTIRYLDKDVRGVAAK